MQFSNVTPEPFQWATLSSTSAPRIASGDGNLGDSFDLAPRQDTFVLKSEDSKLQAVTGHGHGQPVQIHLVGKGGRSTQFGNGMRGLPNANPANTAWPRGNPSSSGIRLSFLQAATT